MIRGSGSLKIQAGSRPGVDSGGGSASAYASTVLATSGLVSYWRLGEPSGTSAADAKGTNTGTYTGGFTLAQTGALAGDSDTAVGLNGTTGYVPVTANASLRPASLTLECWVYPTALDSGSGILCSNSFTTAVGLEIGLGIDTTLTDTTLKVGSYNGSWHIAADPGSALPLNTWTYLVATYDGSNITLYKNGSQVAQTAFAGPLSYDATEFRIGRRHDGGNTAPFWAGRIDEVAVYNVALSGATIASHYNAR